MLTLIGEFVLFSLAFSGGYYVHMKFGAKISGAEDAAKAAVADIKKL